MSGRALRSLITGVVMASCAGGSVTSAQSVSPKSYSFKTYSIQVGAFPTYEQAAGFIDQLRRAGERPVWGTAEVPGRGIWVRVLVGTFPTVKAARDHGIAIKSRRLIQDFLIKDSSEYQEYSAQVKSAAAPGTGQVKGTDPLASAAGIVRPRQVTAPPAQVKTPVTIPEAVALPAARPINLAAFIHSDWNVPDSIDRRGIQFSDATFTGRHFGGLWVGGDVNGALTRLRWIAGTEKKDAISVDKDGRVAVDKSLLTKTCGHGTEGWTAGEQTPECLRSNEGLLLLFQMAFSSHKYLLQVATSAPTLGGTIPVQSAINFDNRFDSRINPRRPHGLKYPNESPPEGFDDLIAISPAAEWVNLRTGKVLPPGIVTFHELAEAYSKIDLHMDYLPERDVPGAHETAVARELKLQGQRPGPDVIVSEGRNRVFESEAELVRYRSSLRLKE